MSKIDLKNFFQILRKTQLTKVEKLKLRNQISKFIGQHPVANPTLSRRRSFGSFLWRRSPLAFGAFLAIGLVLVGGTTLTLAAQSSVPGELLYQVKVRFNAEVQLAFALTPSAKAQALVRQAENRLQEAESLTQSGRLDENTAAQVNDGLQKLIKKVDSSLSQLRDSGKADSASNISSSLEAKLKGHQQVLQKLESDRPNLSKLRPILDNLGSEIRSTQTLRGRSEQHVTTQASSKVKAAAESAGQKLVKKIDQVQKRIKKLKTFPTNKLFTSVQTQLQKSQAAKQQGDASLVAENFSEAFTVYQQALRDAEEAQTALENGLYLRLEIDQKNSVDQPVEKDRTNSRWNGSDKNK